MSLIAGDAVSERFDGDFTIDFPVGAVGTAAETAYRDRVRALLDEMALQDAADTDPHGPPTGETPFCSKAMLEARAKLRWDAAMWLRRSAVAVQEGTLDPAKALMEAEHARATWVMELQRLSKRLFFVDIVYGEKMPDSEERYAIDLGLLVRDGLPPPQNEPGDAKQALFVDLYSALNVIKSICLEMRYKPGRPFSRLLSKKERMIEAERPARALHDYVMKVYGISELGLAGSQTSLARFALASLKEEVLSQQARRIKNTYVTALGLCALAIGTLLFLPYVLISFDRLPVRPEPALPFGAEWWRDHRSFFLTGIGAAAGTWLSFSIRNVSLTFEQLASVERDMLNPPLRLFFVLGLTLAAYLLFWTGAVSLSVGSLKVDVESLKQAGSTAFLVGLLCGLSERTLATAISTRSETFVTALNGSVTSPAAVTAATKT